MQPRLAATWVLAALLGAVCGHAGLAAELPLLVGGQAHGAENIRTLAELGLGNFVWIPKPGYSMGNRPWDRDPKGPNGILTDVDACLAHGFSFAISQRRGLGRLWRPGGGEYGGDGWGDDVLVDAATMGEIARRAGPRFAGVHAEELDIDFIQNGRRASYRSRLPELYAFSDRAGGRAHLETELARLATTYHGYAPGVQYWANMSLLQHSGFRAGADLVLGELLESLPTTELQLAFLRGGGRQFGRPWGVWVSPWNHGDVPCEDKSLWPAAPAVVGGGHAASAFRRCLYLAYASGARVLTVQETEPLFSRREAGNPASGYQLAAWGRELKSFWDYAQSRPQTLQPQVTVALLMDRDCGWAPGNLHGGWVDKETVWAKLPVDDSDQMISGVLEVLAPGFGRQAPGSWDKGRLYPGYFASSPAGPFDVVQTDISSARLATYPVVVAVGDLRLTPELLSRLRDYVAGGGQLLLNAYQMRRDEAFVQDPEFLGTGIGTATIASEWAGQTISGRRLYPAAQIVPLVALPGVRMTPYTEPWFVAQDLQPLPGTEILASTAATDGQPVLLRHAFGQGSVYLCAAEYMTDGYQDRRRVLGYCADLLRGLATQGKVQVTAPGTATPAPDLSWIAARRGADGTVLVLANHASAERTVEVTWRAPGQNPQVEVGTGRLTATRQEGDAVVFTLALAAEDVLVLGVR
jgi:hypothetical protein